MHIPNGFGQINWHLGITGSTRPAEVTLGVELSSFAGTPDDAAETARDEFAAAFLASVTEDVFLQETTIKYGPNDVGPVGTAAGGGSGAFATATSSPQVCYLISKKTALGGRKHRGRMYMPGVAESNVDSGGFILTAEVTFFQDKVDDFLTAMTAANLVPCLLHGEADAAMAPDTITQFIVQSKAATQRRRLRK